MKAHAGLVLVLFAVVVGTGCQTVYNTALEKVFGYEKRELLKKSVASLQSEQQDAQKEFKDAMARLRELYGFQGGQLEASYNKLKGSYDNCEAEAKAVQSRIENMEGIASSMFAEWEKELQQYSNPALAASSRQQLGETRTRYAQLSRTVRASADAMKPVLAQLKDNVLFLKHNLNAAAIGSLKGEAANIQTQIEQLLARMSASIAESDAFIKAMAK